MWLFCPHLECDYHVHTCTKEQRQWGNKRRRNTDELKRLCRGTGPDSQCCLISSDDKRMTDYCSWKFKYWNEWLLNVFKKGINCLRNQTPWVSNAEIIILTVTQRFSCNCTNTAREKKEKQGLEEERGSESETRASSGPVSLKSWPVAFCHDTPFAGLFKSGQARKTAGHELQATDELITKCTLFDCVTVGMYSNLVLSSRKRVRRKVVHDRNTFHKTVSMIYS